VAEGARLESVFTRKGNVGSNPTLSAKLLKINELNSIFELHHAPLAALISSLE
jgi:hypothetical protein